MVHAVGNEFLTREVLLDVSTSLVDPNAPTASLVGTDFQLSVRTNVDLQQTVVGNILSSGTRIWWCRVQRKACQKAKLLELYALYSVKLQV